MSDETAILIAANDERWREELRRSQRQTRTAVAAIVAVRSITAEDAATSSRDYGRGYAQALRDVNAVLDKVLKGPSDEVVR